MFVGTVGTGLLYTDPGKTRSVGTPTILVLVLTPVLSEYTSPDTAGPSRFFAMAR